MIVIPFRVDHFRAIDIQPAQARVRDMVRADDLAALEAGASYTCMHNRAVLACFGWIEIYPHRGSLWALLSASCGRHMTGMTRIAKRLIESAPFRRLEIDVDCEFEQGHRWARMLGFSLEAERLRGYRMDGGDSAIYARIRA